MYCVSDWKFVRRKVVTKSFSGSSVCICTTVSVGELNSWMPYSSLTTEAFGSRRTIRAVVESMYPSLAKLTSFPSAKTWGRKTKSRAASKVKQFIEKARREMVFRLGS